MVKVLEVSMCLRCRHVECVFGLSNTVAIYEYYKSISKEIAC